MNTLKDTAATWTSKTTYSAPHAAAPEAPRPVVKPVRARSLLCAGNVMTLFTAHFLAFLWLDYCGARPYPSYFTAVYFAVLAGVSLSNLLRRSRWFM